LFSNSIAPPIVGASLKALDMLMADSSLPQKIYENTRLFRTEMKKAGFTISGHDNCPISPVMLGDAKLASDVADDLLERGIYVIGFSFPVVPKGLARIRVQLSAAHTTEQIKKTIAAFIEVGKARKIIQ
jgi:glycine C-acetyltransferase